MQMSVSIKVPFPTLSTLCLCGVIFFSDFSPLRLGGRRGSTSFLALASLVWSYSFSRCKLCIEVVCAHFIVVLLRFGAASSIREQRLSSSTRRLAIGCFRQPDHLDSLPLLLRRIGQLSGRKLYFREALPSSMDFFTNAIASISASASLAKS